MAEQWASGAFEFEQWQMVNVQLSGVSRRRCDKYKNLDLLPRIPLILSILVILLFWVCIGVWNAFSAEKQQQMQNEFLYCTIPLHLLCL